MEVSEKAQDEALFLTLIGKSEGSCPVTILGPCNLHCKRSNDISLGAYGKSFTRGSSPGGLPSGDELPTGTSRGTESVLLKAPILRGSCAPIFRMVGLRLPPGCTPAEVGLFSVLLTEGIATPLACLSGAD